MHIGWPQTDPHVADILEVGKKLLHFTLSHLRRVIFAGFLGELSLQILFIALKQLCQAAFKSCNRRGIGTDPECRGTVIRSGKTESDHRQSLSHGQVQNIILEIEALQNAEFSVDLLFLKQFFRDTRNNRVIPEDQKLCVSFIYFRQPLDDCLRSGIAGAHSVGAREHDDKIHREQYRFICSDIHERSKQRLFAFKNVIQKRSDHILRNGEHCCKYFSALI